MNQAMRAFGKGLGLFTLTVLAIFLIVMAFFVLKLFIGWSETQSAGFSFARYFGDASFNSLLTGVIITIMAFLFLGTNYYLKVLTAKLKGN